MRSIILTIAFLLLGAGFAHAGLEPVAETPLSIGEDIVISRPAANIRLRVTGTCSLERVGRDGEVVAVASTTIHYNGWVDLHGLFFSCMGGQLSFLPDSRLFVQIIQPR